MIRYGIDADGVFVDFDKACAWAMNRAPELMSPETWDLLSQPSESWYFKRDLVGPTNWSWFWDWAVPELRPFATAPPFRHEYLYLQKLKGEVFVITCRPEVAREQTYYWLGDHKVNVNGVLHVADPKEKIEFVNALDLDVYVDDHPHTAADMLGRVRAKLFLFDQPWNQGVMGIDRIKSLEELL